MALDGLLIKGLVQELSRDLALGRIDKVYQPTKEHFVLSIRTKNGSKKLSLSCNSDHPGVFITEESFENPMTPSPLCMLFRKHLLGGRICQISQVETERIMEIFVESFDELGEKVKKKIVIELMGRYSNILLCQETKVSPSNTPDKDVLAPSTENAPPVNSELIDSYKIVDSIKRGSLDANTNRLILPAQPYSYPPSQEKIPFTALTDGTFLEGYPSNKAQAPEFWDSLNFSQLFQGISAGINGELFNRSSESGTSPMEVLCKIIKDVEAFDYTPTIWFKTDSIPKDIHIVQLSALSSLEQVTFDSISSALEKYYLSRSTSNVLEQKRLGVTKSVNALIKKVRLKRLRLENDIVEAENATTAQLFGELLMANLHLAKTGDTKVNVVNYYDDLKITIPLDKRYSPSKNAQNYFKKYSKSKRTVKEKAVQIEKVATELYYLESILSHLEQADSLSQVYALEEELIETGFISSQKAAKLQTRSQKSKKNKPSLLQLVSVKGNPILIGRNNKENEHLTFEAAGRKDLWFHTKDIPGSHVVLVLDGKDPTEEEVFQAAELAASYSQSKGSENVPVDYVQIKNVKKMKGGKLGMVTFTGNRTVYVTPK